MEKLDVAELRRKYLDKLVFVVIDDPYSPIAERGRVTEVDDAGQLHGTWGGLAAIPGVDHIELL